MALDSKLRVLRKKETLEKKVVVDVWVKQSELMWRTVYTTPAIATAVFAGWYVVAESKKPLAYAVLGVGVFMMALQGLVIHRMARYLNVLRRAVGDDLPHVSAARVPYVGVPLPKGNHLAVALPIILGLLFSLMMLLSWLQI